MSQNGRRAWRAAAKKLRRKLGLRWRSQDEWLYGKRWSELVPDLEAHRGHIIGAWFRRHGFTEQGLRKFDSSHPVRVYIGLWGGDGVEYAVKPKPFTASSLVGMTMGSRKRVLQDELSRYIGDDDFDYGDVVAHFADPLRIGKRLRPCPGCSVCARPCHYCEMQEPDDSRCPRCRQVMYSKPICDGSGVLPARKSK